MVAMVIFPCSPVSNCAVAIYASIGVSAIAAKFSSEQ